MSRRAPRCACEATFTMRAGAGAAADARSRSSSRLVSRNGARWLTAIVSSYPSCDLWYRGAMIPALLTSTSSRSCRFRIVSARERTEARLAKSARAVSTNAVSRRSAAKRLATSSLARSVRVASRPAITTRNPARARPSAVSNPIPALAPVTRASRADPSISACFQSLGLVDLFGLRAGEKIHQRLGGQGLLGKKRRARDIDDIRVRPCRQLFREGKYPGAAYQLVYAALGKDRDIDRIVRRNLLLAGCIGRVCDHELVFGRSFELRGEFLQGRLHRLGAHDLEFGRAGVGSHDCAHQKQGAA